MRKPTHPDAKERAPVSAPAFRLEISDEVLELSRVGAKKDPKLKPRPYGGMTGSFSDISNGDPPKLGDFTC